MYDGEALRFLSFRLTGRNAWASEVHKAERGSTGEITGTEYSIYMTVGPESLANHNRHHSSQACLTI